MRILHLSDLHFDISDPNELLLEKWKQMVSFLKEQGPIDVLCITGDCIFYANPKENMELFLRYISYLTTELSIEHSRIFMCSGNHEWTPLADLNLCTHMGELPLTSDNQLNEFIKIFERICERKWNYGYEIFRSQYMDLVIIEAAFCISSDGKYSFVRNCQAINNALSKIDTSNNLIIAQHAEESFYCHKCVKAVSLPENAVILCGHKDFLHRSRYIARDSAAIIHSGIAGGFADVDSTYGIYQVEKDGIRIDYFSFSEGDWHWLRTQ